MPNFKPNRTIADSHDRNGLNVCRKVLGRNNAKFYAVQQSTIRFNAEFVRITEIWPNHMTESAECLPKGIRVERSDFD